MSITMPLVPHNDLDTSALLALNAAHEAETSPLDAAELRRLLAQAWLCAGRGEGGCDAFLLAFDQDADYASPNYVWFRERHARFVYVDRIIVASAARGRGLARSLYEELFAAAQRDGHARVCCEVNVDPPNPASDAFHAALGFVEVGRAHLAGRGKTVRYLERLL